MSDVLQAKAFAVFISSILGEAPKVNVYDTFVEIEFTDKNRAYFEKLMNEQIFKLARPTDEAPPTIQIKFGELVLPWALKYLIPITAGSFILGRLTKR